MFGTFPGAHPIERTPTPLSIRPINAEARPRAEEGAPPGFTFNWPSKNDPAIACGELSAIPANHLAGIELFFKFNPDIPVPIAAEAELFAKGVAEPVLALPLAFGNPSSIGSNAWWGDKISAANGSNEWLRLETLWTRGGAAPNGPLERLADQTTSGYLIMKPSRLVALGTQAFERYYGQTLKTPVSIEIVTVGARQTIGLPRPEPRRDPDQLLNT
jgi:hypothetical protein